MAQKPTKEWHLVKNPWKIDHDEVKLHIFFYMFITLKWNHDIVFVLIMNMSEFVCLDVILFDIVVAPGDSNKLLLYPLYQGYRSHGFA